MSAPKVATKEAFKRKKDEKDNRPCKKGPGTPTRDKQLKQSSPPKPSHGVGKELMTRKGLIAQGAVCHLLTHKEHAIEMVESIIKEMDLNPCAEQMTEDLGASGLFDLFRVCFFPQNLSHFLFALLLTVFFFFFLRHW